MHERDGIRLMQYLDGTLPATERRGVEAWLAVDPEARRIAAQHRALWELLGDADTEPVPAADEEFRRRTLQRAGDPGFAAWKPRRAALIAASLLVGVVVFAWHDAASRSVIGGEDLLVVGNLDLLERLEFADAHGTALDDMVYASVLRTFPAVDDAPPSAAPMPETTGAPR
jgi:hypothetical protein